VFGRIISTLLRHTQRDNVTRDKLVLLFFFLILDWGPVPHFCPLEALQPVWLIVLSLFSKRSYSVRQVLLASTTRGSPLAVRGGTMGEKWWPDGAWDMYPGFCDMGPIILLPFRRKAC
jgi:hypothetical protein